MLFTRDLRVRQHAPLAAAAREHEVPMPVAATVHQLIQGLVGRGYGEADFAALLQQQAESAGLTLVSEHADVPDGLDTTE